MEVLEFARKHLQPFTQKGSEIIPEHCPYCKGGEHRDKETFALNLEHKVFKCHRGKCGKQGHFTELCRDFGEMDNFEPFKREKQYTKPKADGKPLNDTAVAYMAKRGISKATLEACDVQTDEGGNLRFNFRDEQGELVFTKYRPSCKVVKGVRKAWRDSGTKPILYLMHLCAAKAPLVIVEGEIDALTLIECGVKNAVSVPSGTKDLTFLDTCFDFLNTFEQITLFADDDEPGRELAQKLIGRLGVDRVCIVPCEAYKGCKDANELLYRHGKEAVTSAVGCAKPVPVAGLLELADVTPLDFSKAERISSGIKCFDSLLGGFMMGQLTVWTGKRSEGKSTFLGQMLLEAVNAGFKVCAYSGELQAEHFQYVADLQAAGEEHVKRRLDTVKGGEVSFLPTDTRSKIHNWYRGKFFIYDNAISQGNEAKSILQVFEHAVKRYDAKVFAVDNLMTMNYSGSGKDFYNKQSAVCGELAAFAKKYNVHVHLVAHPRKTSDTLTSDDVAGSSDVTNRADNVVSLRKLEGEEAAANNCSAILKVLKNRLFGEVGEIALDFCQVCRRFSPAGAGQGGGYGWNTSEVEQINVLEDLPF